MGEIIVPVITEIIHDSVMALVEFVGCYLSQLFVAPVSFVNHVLCGLIDMIVNIIPRTPYNLRIANLAHAMANENPLGWFIGGRVLTRVFPMLVLLMGVKGWKLWRP